MNTMNTNRPEQCDYDVVVVGARCAGASTAMLLARQGLRVLVVDRGREGSDTLSTHALMRGAVVQLSRWGLLESLIAAGTPAIRSTSFHYADEVIDIAIKPRDGVSELFAPRRTVLDPILVDAARRAGAEVRFGCSVMGLTRSRQGRVEGVTLKEAGQTFEVKTRLLIGADGVRSTMAQLVAASSYRHAHHATGVIYGYWSGLDLEGYHWYFRTGVSAGAIPTNDGLSCVFASMPERRFRELATDTGAGYRKVLQESAPELERSLETGKLAGGLRSFPGIRGFMRQSWGPGWALVGDAGYFRDPLTAHGITDALRDAELLARAAAEGSDRAMAGYQAERDDLSLGFFEATNEIASFSWDLPRVQELHVKMSREMNRETERMAGLDAGKIRKIA